MPPDWAEASEINSNASCRSYALKVFFRVVEIGFQLDGLFKFRARVGLLPFLLEHLAEARELRDMRTAGQYS